MSTIKFELLSDKFGKFNIDSSCSSNDQLNCYIQRNQYESIISKINQRITNFKSPLKISCLVGTVIIILSIMVFFILRIQIQTVGDIFGFIIFILFISIIGIMTVCCVTCDRFNKKEKEKRFRKLQADIQTIADEEFMTTYQIAYAKWTIEKLGDQLSGRRFKLTAEFRLQYQRATASSVHELPNWESIRLVSPIEALPVRVLELNTEQTTTAFTNERQSRYENPPSTPPPPSYNKVICSFSQGTFADCSNCNNLKCVFNSKYCTQCGHSFSI